MCRYDLSDVNRSIYAINLRKSGHPSYDKFGGYSQNGCIIKIIRKSLILILMGNFLLHLC